MNEYIAGATIVLVERKDGGLFSEMNCKEIASAVTDANGECFFDREKLKKNKSFSYFCAVKESWGTKHGYPCAGIAERFIKKGGTQAWLMTNYEDGFIRVQYNNLLTPSQPNDSLVLTITVVNYYDPVGDRYQGGGGVFFAGPYYSCNGFPFPAKVTTAEAPTPAGRLLVKTRKRKMGIVTTNTDTVKAYPNKTTIVEVNW